MGIKKKLGQQTAETESRSTQAQRALMAEREKKYDPTATDESMIDDLRRVQAMDPSRFVTRNYYREHGKYSDFNFVQRFGTFHEFRREAGLELHRGAQRVEKAIALHASRDRYRGFFEVEIQPWVGKYEKSHSSNGMKTMLIGSDFHDKDADPFALSVFIDTALRVQPDIIVLNGDVFDEMEFSRFDKDPRLTNVKERFDFVKKHIFKPLRDNCPNAQIDFIIGNHDIRVLRHMADRTPYLRPLLDLMGVSLSKVFGLEEFEINLISKGDFAAHQPKESRDEMKKNYKKYFNCLILNHEPSDFGMCSIAGHTHKPKFESKVNELVGDYFNLTLGCIAKVDCDYVQGLNNYQNGFALVHIDPKLLEVVPEPIVFTDHYAMVGGKLYKRRK